MDLLNILFVSGVVVFAFMTLWFMIGILTRDFSSADLAWPLGIIALSIALLAIAPAQIPRQVLIIGLILVWGVRLAVHLFIRNSLRKPEERYSHWQRLWGELTPLKAYFQIYLLQGLLILIVAAPVWMVLSSPGEALTFADAVAVAIWAIGFFIESASDLELLLFKRRNPGQVLGTGMWSLSRHPNYFGELLQWWAIFIVAAGTPFGLLALISPVMLSFLILGVTGIPTVERRMSRASEYNRYRKVTSMFIPWFPLGNQ